MIIAAYRKSIEIFIVKYLPYIELLIENNIDEHIEMYVTNKLYVILMCMFHDKIVLKKIQHINEINDSIPDIEKILEELFGELTIKKITRSLEINTYKYIKNKNCIIIHPKNSYSCTDKMTHIDVDNITKIFSSKDKQYELLTVGENLNDIVCDSRLKNIGIIQDILSYMRYCKIFITSECDMHYIALMCGCKNIIVYNKEKKYSPEIINYNPFNSDILIVDDMNSIEINKFINEHLS